LDKTLEDHAQRWSEIMPLILRKLIAIAGEAAAQVELSMTQAEVLSYLTERHETTMGELSDHISVSLSAMTGVVDSLVQKGLVSRDRDETDRRVVRVSLTPAGEELAAEVGLAKKVHAMAVLGALDQSDRERLLEIMAKLTENLPSKYPLNAR
jgi:DNA-binding MarR family transcriptional regulator